MPCFRGFFRGSVHYIHESSGPVDTSENRENRDEQISGPEAPEGVWEDHDRCWEVLQHRSRQGIARNGDRKVRGANSQRVVQHGPDWQKN